MVVGPAETESMYYSTYRKVTVSTYLVVFGLLGAWALSLNLIIGIVFILAVSLIGLVAFWVSFGLIEATLDEHGGRIPMPNAGLGLWGIDLVDETRDWGPGGPNGYSEPDYDSNELEEPGYYPHCPFCHAELARDEAKFCDECGKPLTPAPKSPT